MSIPKLMRHYRCDAATAALYVCLRLQGYPREFALSNSILKA